MGLLRTKEMLKEEGNFPTLPLNSSPPRTGISKEELKPRKDKNLIEVKESKKQSKKKKVVEVTTNDNEAKEEEDYSKLIKESVKEALQGETQRPIQTSQGQKLQKLVEPV